ncbi:HAMP domain-containing protein [Sphingomonas sp. AP4-R1]|uniref:sensor histidine kinase n=1 Tax=Sphingomonas sp. AP4-R1 TaxID=2735134 RepID=UPI0014933B22|nr:ATP-binding protein [Sphingomonas sp. AP4-R1]QJU59702.1 HAMP domain-containing protein [Sphingomonas sp. AP4-R1]
MASAIVSRRNDGLESWLGRLSLTARILAVNIFALIVLAGGFFYLDSYRSQLIEERTDQAETEVRMAARAIATAPADERARMLTVLGQANEGRFRFYPAAGTAPVDGWASGTPTYELRDPSSEPWQRHVARALDRAIDSIVGAEVPEPFVEPAHDTLAAWPEATAAARSREVQSHVRRAPDRTPVISAAMSVPGGGVLLMTTNQRDVVRTVRAERFWLGIVLLGTSALSIFLSIFLARTIARPLRRLAIAAHRVRLGRSREVQVPRLPARRDEIGTLARALSDMSQALRQRIDATEAFAADVAHEIKNPLASLRSAVDSLERIDDPDLRARLVAIIRDDVGRLDRLITDISEASRMDAQLSRARFETIDLGTMIEQLVAGRDERGVANEVRLAFARPNRGTALIFGDGHRLARAIENLVDNAISFSPPGGLVQVAATRDRDEIVVRVEDDGPGVPEHAREAIFNRFHSIRPEGEEFGRHSGLGLAIAKAIVEGHGGRIYVSDRDGNVQGARFTIRLPAAQR